MKTQILQLEAHDDVVSTRDKISASQARRVLLVWNSNAHLLNRKLDLVLLQRHSAALGIQLGLVAKDEAVRYYAAQLGIPAFQSTRQAQIERWRAARRTRRPFRPARNRAELTAQFQAAHQPPPAWLSHPALRLSLFSLSLAAVLAVAALLFPSAQITLSPNVQEQSLAVPVRANPSLQQPLLTGELPVVWVSVIVEGRDSLPASGATLAPERAAIGSVVFRNLTEQAVEIPAGVVVTTLETPPRRFITTRAVVAPAGIGESVEAPIQAMTPGSSGNLPANRLQAIEGALGLSLTVNNPEPTRQGRDQPVASPTEQDRRRLYERLRASLQNTARQEIERRFSNNASAAQDGGVSDFPLLETLRLKQALEETFQPEVGQPGEVLSLLLRLEFEVQVVSATHLQALAAPLLSASLPEGYQPLPDTLRIEHQPPFESDESGRLQWTIVLRQKIYQQINPAQAAALGRGMSVQTAPRQLQKMLALDQTPTIQVFPSWMPVLPYLPSRIEVRLESDDD